MSFYFSQIPVPVTQVPVAHNGSGTQYQWHTVAVAHSGSGKQWQWHTVAVGNSDLGTQWR